MLKEQAAIPPGLTSTDSRDMKVIFVNNSDIGAGLHSALIKTLGG